MTSQLKAKLLQHFAGKKKANGGFTLIELLVVIIIIGILSAIALPSFLNQANKAKQSEAKTYVGSVNRAQQAYYMENGKMATNERFAQLGLGIRTNTDNYGYAITSEPAGGTGEGDFTVATAIPKTPVLKLYAGGVKTANIGADGADVTNLETTTLAVLCEALLSRGAGGLGTGVAEGDEDVPAQITIADAFVNMDDDQATEPNCNEANTKQL